ncbi:DUF6600 domain-containing protein [Pararcticibacter amylolyticus]|uniref:Uncharacterized protein n=1 Tax=Pararcticibacter amylolyticus TaxID=2173175 RepID=A0A2U2PKY6_9SPHI|nr:DUF6600 domain-containing protein [Pararcticibacter amylolyticus]PWG82065.1 hypothetical protein DDR33_03325 [Pararcticibacter amylolyticus]
MKALRRIPLLCLLFLITGSITGTGRANAQPGVSVSLQVFYDELAPYGRWMDYRGHGRVWIPAVDAGFQPYGTRGHWVVTEYGNTWVSDYDWGWAPFHYGRWLYDDYYGWMWIPGSDWGPAWVSWRSGGGYYGWAPLSPGIDININVNIPLLRWIFVPERYIASPAVYSYCIPQTRRVNVYHSTTIINNIYVNNNRRYFYGPQRRDIERATGSRVVVRHVDYQDRPGRTYADNRSVRVYRPEVRRDGEGRDRNDRYSPGSPGRDNLRPGTYDRPDRYNRPDRFPSYSDNKKPGDRQNSPDKAISNPSERTEPRGNDQNPYWRGRDSRPSREAGDNSGSRPDRPPGREYPAQRQEPSQPQRDNTPRTGEGRQRPDIFNQRTEQSGPQRDNSQRTPERQRPETYEQRPQRTERGSRPESQQNRGRSNSSGERPGRAERPMRG